MLWMHVSESLIEPVFFFFFNETNSKQELFSTPLVRCVSILHTHQYSIRMFSGHRDGESIHRHIDSFSEAHYSAPTMFILNGHIKRYKTLFINAQGRQLIHTRALEVKTESVERVVMWVSWRYTYSRAHWLTAASSINHWAALTRGARRFTTHHDSQVTVTLAQAMTLIISPERLALLVVGTFERTATLIGGHTSASTEDKTAVTNTSFHTGVSAITLLIWVRTCYWTRRSTGLIMTARRAGHSCWRTRRGSWLKLKLSNPQCSTWQQNHHWNAQV